MERLRQRISQIDMKIKWRELQMPPTQRHKRKKGISFHSNNESRSTSRDITKCEKRPDIGAKKSNYSIISFTSTMHSPFTPWCNEGVPLRCKQRIKFSCRDCRILTAWSRKYFPLTVSEVQPNLNFQLHPVCYNNAAWKNCADKINNVRSFFDCAKSDVSWHFSCFFRLSPRLFRSLHVFFRDNKYVKIYAFRTIFQQHFYSNVFRHILASRGEAYFMCQKCSCFRKSTHSTF